MKAPNSLGDFLTTVAPSLANCFSTSARVLRRGQRRVQLVDDRLRRAGRRDDAPPVDRLVGRHAGFRRPSARRAAPCCAPCEPTPSALELAGLDVRRGLHQRGEHHLGVAADHVDHRRAAALERHVQHVDAGLELEQLAAEMLEASRRRRTRTACRRACCLASATSSLIELTGSVGLTATTFGPEPITPIGAKVLDRIVGQLVEPRIDRVRERNDQQRVAVRRRLARRARCRSRRRRRRGCRSPPACRAACRAASPIMRPTTSLLPPGGNGMISRTGRFG